MARTRNRQTIFAKPTHMELDRSLDSTECTVDRFSGCDASRQIGYRCAPVAIGITVDAYQVLNGPHDFDSFNSACRLTDASVPFGMSSPKLPLIVTRPRFTGCLNW